MPKPKRLFKDAQAALEMLPGFLVTHPRWGQTDFPHRLKRAIAGNVRGVDLPGEPERLDFILSELAWCAVDKRDLLLLQLVLEAGAKTDQLSRPRGGAIILATGFDLEPELDLMLQFPNGSDFNLPADGNQLNPLRTALAKAHYRIVHKLIVSGLVDSNGIAPGSAPIIIDALRYAVGEGYNSPEARTLRVLLSLEQVELNVGSRDSGLPFTWAVLAGDYWMVRAMLKCSRLHPNQQDEDGNTALHNAAARGHVGRVKMLLRSRRIDRDVRNFSGLTAERLAHVLGNSETEAIFGTVHRKT